MLRSQLKLVVLVVAQFIGPRFQPFKRGHASLRGIDSVAARDEDRNVDDAERRKRAAALVDELAQRLHAIAHALRVRPLNRYAIGFDVQRVGTGGGCGLICFADHQVDETRIPLLRRQLPVQSRMTPQILEQLVREQPSMVPHVRAFADSTGEWQPDQPSGKHQMFRLRNQSPPINVDEPRLANHSSSLNQASIGRAAPSTRAVPIFFYLEYCVFHRCRSTACTTSTKSPLESIGRLNSRQSST